MCMDIYVIISYHAHGCLENMMCLGRVVHLRESEEPLKVAVVLILVIARIPLTKGRVLEMR